MSKEPVLKFAVFILLSVASSLNAQQIRRDFPIQTGSTVQIINIYGRVDAVARTAAALGEGEAIDNGKNLNVSFTANSAKTLAENELKIDTNRSGIRIEVVPAEANKRIDISITLPSGVQVKIETGEGEVRVSGELESAEVRTDTGTIAADVPTDDLKYAFHWTASRPRFLSDIELEKVKEKTGGKFEIKGRFRLEAEKVRNGDEEIEGRGDAGSEPPAAAGGLPDRDETSTERAKDKNTKTKVLKTKVLKPRTISLNFTTARGIILLNIPPNEVSSDLRERPLTNAAKAIIRSGDSLLMEAIRRATPKYFGDYTRTLPPVKMEPAFAEKTGVEDIPGVSVKKAAVRVTDLNNRAIAGLEPKDFEVMENNVRREILSVRPITAPFNLVLLLDVSGSVDAYVNFIRKAARNFVETVDNRDRISIVTFNEDVKLLSRFTTNKTKLSESLDTFDAGGGTAYYDALAYTLAETLRPLKGERTAIVILTDGDDNRSFLPFDSLLASIQESGALVYPLYVPSALIAAAESKDTNAEIDTLRSRYMTLTSKAEGEGEKLARASGGVYYPISQISQIQKAYDDIVRQLRTAYTVTFRSETTASKGSGASPRLKIKINKPNAFASIGSVLKASEPE